MNLPWLSRPLPPTSSTWHGVAVDERVEVDDLDLAGTDDVDEALDQAAVQAAHEIGVGLGQLAERAVGERDRVAVSSSPAIAGSKPRRSSSATSASRHGRRLTCVPSARPCSRPASAASSAPVPARRRPQQHAGEDGERSAARARARAHRPRASSGAGAGRPRRGCRSAPRAGRRRACARGGAARC